MVSLRSKRFASQTEASLLENRASDGHMESKYAELSQVLNGLDSLDDYDQVNGFLSATGSNCAASDTQRSFYDFEEAQEQVFSPPLLMDSSLLADYEDLLGMLLQPLLFLFVGCYMYRLLSVDDFILLLSAFVVPSKWFISDGSGTRFSSLYR